MKTCAVLGLALLIACGGSEQPAASTDPAKPTPPPLPSAQQARDMIANSAELGEYEFTNAGFTTPVSAKMMSEPVKQSVQELAAAGWLKLDGAGDVSLTDKSQSDKRFLLRPNGLLDIVPLAKKEMGDVTSVRANDDGTARVDFTWRWIANEVGSAFKTGPVAERYAAQQDGTATLIWDGTSWSILKIE
jgi:hypothetical protein